MTLDKHIIQGVPPITVKVLAAQDFNQRLQSAGYEQMGTAPAQGNRLKAWWTHPIHPRVEVIYSPDGEVAITAYHVN
jgi:hypothetical protein